MGVDRIVYSTTATVSTDTVLVSMAGCLHIVTRIALLATGTAIGCITLRGAGGRCDDGIVFVAEGGNGFGFAKTASEAHPILGARFGTGRCRDELPGIEGMAQSRGVIGIVVIITARTTVMGIALPGTRSGDYGDRLLVRRIVGQSTALRVGISIATAYHVKNHVGTAVEHIGARVVGLLDPGQRFGDHDLFQPRRVPYGDKAQLGNSLLQRNGSEILTKVKGLLTNGLDVSRDGNFGQRVAVTECRRADRRDRCGNADASQACAIIKQAIRDLGQS